jgi:hypothetical protein
MHPETRKYIGHQLKCKLNVKLNITLNQNSRTAEILIAFIFGKSTRPPNQNSHLFAGLTVLEFTCTIKAEFTTISKHLYNQRPQI